MCVHVAEKQSFLHGAQAFNLGDGQDQGRTGSFFA